MPIISITIVPQEYEKKKEIVKVFTAELSRITGIPKEPIVVNFHELSPENGATGGIMLAEKFKNENVEK